MTATNYPPMPDHLKPYHRRILVAAVAAIELVSLLHGKTPTLAYPCVVRRKGKLRPELYTDLEDLPHGTVCTVRYSHELASMTGAGSPQVREGARDLMFRQMEQDPTRLRWVELTPLRKATDGDPT